MQDNVRTRRARVRPTDHETAEVLRLTRAQRDRFMQAARTAGLSLGEAIVDLAEIGDGLVHPADQAPAEGGE